MLTLRFEISKRAPFKLIIVAGTAKTENYDDIPDDDDETKLCSKKYTKIGRKSSAIAFLFFCPQHGDCYGFHVVNGSEGRKDPFYAMMKYLPIAPEYLFYDFACQLSEYAYNREIAYFRNTQFKHDIFHSTNHNCPYAFHTRNKEDVRYFNTSVAEQFNSYFSFIKKTGHALRLSRFMLYSQHLIFLYNQDKKVFNEKKKDRGLDRLKPEQEMYSDSDDSD